jgi:hypothetical protein
MQGEDEHQDSGSFLQQGFTTRREEQSPCLVSLSCKHQRSVRVFNMLRLAYIVIKESCGGFSFKLVLKWGGAIEPL